MGTAARVCADGESRLEVWQSATLRGVVFSRGSHVTHTYPRHWHDEIHFCAYDAGSGYLAHGGNSRLVVAGDLMVMPPGVVHENWVERPEGIGFVGAYMDVRSISQSLEQIFERPQPLPEFSEFAISDRETQRSFRSLCASAAEDDGLKQEELLLQFLSRIVSSCAANRRTVKEGGHETAAVRRAREYIDEHFQGAISLAELSEITGLSTFHLHRVFCRETGMPPHAYQTQLRINRAKRLLCELRSLSEVALMTGFADQSHFTRQFRRLVGVTPGRFAS
jgi:AraC-like DNA-binding protein